jgi:hypothetical protein
MFKEFIYLIRTGPGSSEYNENLVSLEVRRLACRCIDAVVGSRDNLNKIRNPKINSKEQ